MGKSSLSHSFIRVIKALVKIAPQIIKWPEQNELVDIKRKFASIADLPNVIGAIDGTYIPIKAPKENSEVYITRKCNYAMTLQSICDPSLKFRDSFIAFPGSVSDVRIFRKSHFYEDVLNNKRHFFPQDEFIIGDKAYPILEWCIPPYIDRGNLNEIKTNFNKVHAKTRQVIERSFGLLFGRLRRLRYLDMNRTDWIPSTVIASCVIHNICLDHNDLLLENFINEGLPYVHQNIVNEFEEYQDQPMDGTTKRDNIALSLYEA